jgi:EAL and modified HD-GYP domain-containing signal transduction protein
MITDVYVGRQPILDKKKRIFAYELLFRNTEENRASLKNSVAATCSVIARVLTDMSLEELCGERICFINVDAEFLGTELVYLLPPKKTVLELLETMEFTEDVIRLILGLKEKGYELALDDFEYEQLHLSPISHVDYVKVDIRKVKSEEELKGIVRNLKGFPVKLVAEKVEEMEEFELCEKLGFDYFQGYFFSKPSIHRKKTLSPEQLMIIELYRSLAKDEDIHKIYPIFENSAELSYKLLKLANSPAFYSGEKISSVRYAIQKLGYRNIQKWCVLVLLSGDFCTAKHDPLLERAVFRAKLMELLCSDILSDRKKVDTAFLTGLFSILPSAIGMTLKEIVDHFRLSEDIRFALLEKKGILGTLLQIAESLEKESFGELKGLLTSVNLDLNRLFEREEEAIIGSTLFFKE